MVSSSQTTSSQITCRLGLRLVHSKIGENNNIRSKNDNQVSLTSTKELPRMLIICKISTFFLCPSAHICKIFNVFLNIFEKQNVFHKLKGFGYSYLEAKFVTSGKTLTKSHYRVAILKMVEVTTEFKIEN